MSLRTGRLVVSLCSSNTGPSMCRDNCVHFNGTALVNAMLRYVPSGRTWSILVRPETRVIGSDPAIKA